LNFFFKTIDINMCQTLLQPAVQGPMPAPMPPAPASFPAHPATSAANFERMSLPDDAVAFPQQNFPQLDLYPAMPAMSCDPSTQFTQMDPAFMMNGDPNADLAMDPSSFMFRAPNDNFPMNSSPFMRGAPNDDFSMDPSSFVGGAPNQGFPMDPIAMNNFPAPHSGRGCNSQFPSNFQYDSFNNPMNDDFIVAPQDFTPEVPQDFSQVDPSMTPQHFGTCCPHSNQFDQMPIMF
jgi:hypothetical protein